MSEVAKKPLVVWAAKKNEAGERVDELVMWKNVAGPEAKNPGMIYFTGFAVDNEGKKHYFTAFPVEHEGSVFLSLVDNKGNRIGTANAVNHRADGKEVYFDTLGFNLTAIDKTIFAYTTRSCDAEAHKALGFTSERVPRPKPNEASVEQPVIDENDEPEETNVNRSVAKP